MQKKMAVQVLHNHWAGGFMMDDRLCKGLTVQILYNHLVFLFCFFGWGMNETALILLMQGGGGSRIDDISLITFLFTTTRIHNSL